MSLAEYEQLDLSSDGPYARELIARLEEDVSYGNVGVPVTSAHASDDAAPAYLTPGMKQWYSTYIGPWRQIAIDEVRAAFSSLDAGRGSRGFLAEFERDQIESEKHRQIRSERSQFFSLEEVSTTAEQLAEKREEFRRMKEANGGRDPKQWSPAIYVGLLTALAIPEAFLNYETFVKLKVLTEFMAAGLTGIVAFAIAYASHIVGETFKQWRERFGGHVPETDRRTYARNFFIATSTFSGAMVVVSLARWTLFQGEFNRKLITGELLGFSDYIPFITTISGNLLVFLLGVLISFAAHDAVPRFWETKKEVDATQAKLGRLYRRHLETRKAQAISKAQHASTNLNQREVNQARLGPDYDARRKLFEHLRKTDQKVVGLLEKYRAQLVRQGVSKGRSIRFIHEDIMKPDLDAREILLGEDYLRRPLTMPYA